MRTNPDIDIWETFELVQNSDGTQSIKTYHGTFIKAWVDRRSSRSPACSRP